jgi:uncharacterized membrane protein
VTTGHPAPGEDPGPEIAIPEEEDMEDTIVVIRYRDPAEARQALAQLKQLDADRRLDVRGAALVQRSGDGAIDVPVSNRDDEGLYMPPGGVIGMMFGALKGPLGMLFAGSSAGFEGHGGPSPHAGDPDLLIEEMSRDLEPGVTLVAAEIAEPDPEMLDGALNRLGGIVTKRPAAEVYAEVEAAEHAAGAAQQEARRVLRKPFARR